MYPFALVALIVFAAFSLYGYFELQFDLNALKDIETFQRPGLILFSAIAIVAWLAIFSAKLTTLAEQRGGEGN
jgi:FtsH-binding integral membrane protein